MSYRTEPSRDGGPPKGPLPGGRFDLDRVREAIDGVRFGQVRVIIQDEVIVQIERLERQRLR